MRLEARDKGDSPCPRAYRSATCSRIGSRSSRSTRAGWVSSSPPGIGAAHGRENVAIKTLRDELLVDQERAGRFAAECQLWVKLGRHPNVVQAYSVERIDDRPHIVLELVTGGELRRRIGTRQLDVPQALRYGVEFCLGMEHAIRQGLRCHRDIKPANLLVSAGDHLKITDFGLASIRDELLANGLDGPGPIPLDESSTPQPIVWDDPRDQRDQTTAPVVTPLPAAEIPAVEAETRPVPFDPTPLEFDPESTLDFVPRNRLDSQDTLITHLTRTGVLLGTLPYMAPEQFRDPHSADIRADIYAFGVVLFEILTGELPFKGTTIAKLERQHSRYTPPSVVPSIPAKFGREAERIDKIVHKCLAKDPGERFGTVADLRKALTGVWRRVGGE